MGKELKKECQNVIKYITELDEDAKRDFSNALDANKSVTINLDGREIVVLEKYLTFEEKEIKIHEEKFLPHVIEPSFGLGRILYSVLENTFNVRPGQVAIQGEPLKT